MVSDHCLINAVLQISKSSFYTHEITYRKIKDIYPEAFSKGMLNADLSQKSYDTITNAINRYTSALKQILDKHAPMKTSKITIPPQKPWFNDRIRSVKTERRTKAQSKNENAA